MTEAPLGPAAVPWGHFTNEPSQAMTQTDRATAFHHLHRTPALVLPNAWDAGSARIIEHAGAHAIATTSAGVSWARGRPDGEHLTLPEAVETIRSIVKAVTVPVTADIESGYGDGSPEQVADSVRAVLDAGAVGINLEDAPGNEGNALRPIDEQVSRIQAARKAAEQHGVNAFINARTDVYLAGVGAQEERVGLVLRRATAYLKAGADGIFVPALADVDIIARLVQEIDAPVNIMAGPGAPSVQALVGLGVGRVSLGPAIALGAFGFIHQAATEALNAGTFGTLKSALPFGIVNGLFAHE